MLDQVDSLESNAETVRAGTDQQQQQHLSSLSEVVVNSNGAGDDGNDGNDENNWTWVHDADDLHQLGLDELKHQLQQRGMKCSGTMQVCWWVSGSAAGARPRACVRACVLRSSRTDLQAVDFNAIRTPPRADRTRVCICGCGPGT